MIAPLRNKKTTDAPWEGDTVKKPWDYKVAVAIPVLDTYDELKIVIELLRLQTIKPYIMVIDTGSLPEHYAKIETLRADDLEVHCLRLNGVMHPSDFPAMAMDLAFTLCRSPYLFCTHADCFLKKREFLEQCVELCEVKKVVGYEITPRAHKDWKGMVSHTATMLDMATMDKIGAGWSIRRLCNLFGIFNAKPNPMTPNWPDTELLLNYILRQHKIEPCLIGTEDNFTRNVDANIDHCRTLTSGLLYSPDYYVKARAWAEDAKTQALKRIEEWRAKP